MHMSLCEKYDALKACGMRNSFYHIEYDSNVGMLQQCWSVWFFRIQQQAVCGLNAFMGSHGHIFTLLKQRFVWIYNLSNEFCELIFMVLENGRHFNYFKFSCPCLDPRLCVVKYMKVNCFSDCWHCWRRDQWRHSLVPSHRRLLRRLLKHFVLAATSNFMILWIAILYT